jgi:hypothetical protein
MTPITIRRFGLAAAVVATILAFGVTDLRRGTIDVASPLSDAVEVCHLSTNPYVDVLDDDHTLAIHGDGDEDPGLQLESIACLLSETDTPGAVVERMDQTRALDGMQDADWGEGAYGATWTFHPDHGLNLTITWEQA